MVGRVLDLDFHLFTLSVLPTFSQLNSLLGQCADCVFLHIRGAASSSSRWVWESWFEFRTAIVSEPPFLLPGVAGNGWCKGNADQDGLIHLVGLRNLQEELFAGLLVIRPVEENDSIGSRTCLKTCRA